MNFMRCLGAILLVGGCGSSNLPDGSTRAGLVSGFKLVIEGQDRNGDEKLSLEEIQAMVDSSFKSGVEPELRNRLLQDYARQDLDKDGYLDIAELTKEPLATFDCIDANRDGYIGQPEIEASAGRCGSSEAVAI
jgi:Ca2+-binding EF-hand superfamily protein